MYRIILRSLTEFSESGRKFTLPSKMLRFDEFEQSVVFFLDNEGKHDKVIGVKFSQEGGVNHLYIAWEFQSIDNFGKPRYIDEIRRKIYNGKEAISCLVTRWLTEYIIDPDNGKILDELPTK